MSNISTLFIPLIVLIVILYGLIKKTNVYDSFLEGAKESIEIVLNLFPCLLAMILGINIFINSDLIETIFKILDPFLKLLNIPFEIIPIAIMRTISGSFGLGLLNDIYKQYGVDSFVSLLASVIQGSTDTTLYILTIYFGAIGIKKIKYALWAGLLSDLFAIITSIVVVTLFFK